MPEKAKLHATDSLPMAYARHQPLISEKAERSSSRAPLALGRRLEYSLTWSGLSMAA